MLYFQPSQRRPAELHSELSPACDMKVTLRLPRQKLACQRAGNRCPGRRTRTSPLRSATLLLALLAGVQARADAAGVLRIITLADFVPPRGASPFRKGTRT